MHNGYSNALLTTTKVIEIFKSKRHTCDGNFFTVSKILCCPMSFKYIENMISGYNHGLDTRIPFNSIPLYKQINVVKSYPFQVPTTRKMQIKYSVEKVYREL